MGQFDDYMARRMEAEEAQREHGPTKDYGYVGGFIESTLSSIPEFFWQDPSPEAQQFRQDNPISGFISQALPYMAPYAGALGVVNRSAKLGGLIEGGIGRLGITAAEQPIRYNALRGMAVDALVDVPRAAIGYATAPEGNRDDILGDTILNQAFSGALGAGFGYLTRSGGKPNRAGVGVLAESHPDWNAMRTFREGMTLGAENANIVGGEFQATMDDLMRQNLKPSRNELPPELRPGADWTEDTSKVWNDFARTGSEEPGKLGGRNTRWLTESEDTNLSTLNVGEQAELVSRSGFESIQDLNAHVMNPTEVRFHNADAAKTATERLRTTPGMTYMGEGVWASVEDGGLVRFMKRVDGAKTKAGKPVARSEGQIRNGDVFLQGRTDRLDRIMPGMAAESQPVVDAWATMNDAMRNTNLGVYNQYENATYGTMLKGYGPGDFKRSALMGKGKKENMIAEMATRFSAAAEGMTGGYSHNARQAAERLFDVMAVGAAKNTKNVFRRIPFEAMVQRKAIATHGARVLIQGEQTLTKGPGKMLLGTAKRGNGLNGMKSARQLQEGLTDDELLGLELLEMSRASVDNIEDAVPAELITERMKRAYQGLIDIDLAWQKPYFLDPLIGTPEGGVKMADNYTGAGQTRGQYYVDLMGPDNRVVYQVTDDSRNLAQERAKSFVETANAEGAEWKMGETKSFLQTGQDEVNKAGQAITERLTSARTEQVNSIINKAVKRWAYERYGSTMPTLKPRAPGDLTAGSKPRLSDPTRKPPTLEERLARTEKHYRDLGMFAAYIDGSRRYTPIMNKLNKFDPVAGEDLLHQFNNIFGVKGPTARYLDSKLRGVFGDALGGNAASQIAGTVGSTLYRMQLGILNTTAAVMNLMGTVQLLIPHLAYMRDAPLAAKAAMVDMVPEIFEGKVQGDIAHMSLGKIMGRAIVNLGDSAPQDLKQIHARLDDMDLLGSGSHGEFIGGNSEVASTIRGAYREAGGGIAGYIKGADQIMTFLARNSENLPRVLTVNASYDIGKNILGLEGELLEHFIIKSLRRAMYGHATQDRAKMFTGPIGSTFGLFKNFAFHYINDFMTYAKLAKNEGVYKPLLWQVGSTMAVGGIGATPLRYLADGLANWDEEYPDGATWLSENMGKTGDAMYYGLPAFLGVTLQSSAAMPGTDIVQDSSNMANAVAITKAMEIGKALGAAGAYAVGSGENPLRNENVRDQLFAATMPRAFNRIASVVEGDYVKSMRTGYPSVRDVSVSQRMLQASGLNDLDVAKRAYVGRQLWKQKAETQRVIAALGMRHQQARDNGDVDEMTDVMFEALEAGVDISSVYSSSRTRFRRETREDALSLYGPEAVMEYGIEP